MIAAAQSRIINEVFVRFVIMLVRFYSFLAAKLVPGIEISKCGQGAEDVRMACGQGAMGVLFSSGIVKIFR